MALQARPAALLALLCLAACGQPGNESAPAPYTVDHSDPMKVLNAVMDAARGLGQAHLVGLCDPQHQNDLDTQRICDIGRRANADSSFVAYFASAEVLPGHVMQGDTAIIPLRYGPNGHRQAGIRLIRRDQKWFLLDFGPAPDDHSQP